MPPIHSLSLAMVSYDNGDPFCALGDLQDQERP